MSKLISPLVRVALFAASLAVVFNSAADEPAKLEKLRQVPFTSVSIHDSFWSVLQETNRVASIPVNLDNLENAGNLDNFRLSIQGATNGYHGAFWMDSDVYKAVEAASFTLATHPDPALDKRLDGIIAIIAAAQSPDGYIDTYVNVKQPGKHWANLRDWHEMYSAGHLMEGAVAHYQATGKTNFLSIAIRLADHMDSLFGPAPKRMGYPGHPEAELALIKLWHATGNRRYFELAKFFVENRGTHFFAREHHLTDEQYDGTYWLDDIPIYDHKKIKGHAVRAAYLMSGVTDVAAETGDSRLLAMLDRVWGNTSGKNLYLTGGIGSSASNEGFTVDYDLPNATAYQETCATVALAQWGHRLNLLYGDASYADVVERSLYNSLLSGVSEDGKRFFYVNPMEASGKYHREGWFSCACCPPNAARTIAAVGSYAYAEGSNSLWVNLFIQGELKTTLNGTPVGWKVTTDYPWDGKVTLKASLPAKTDFQLRLRIPGWSEGATVSLNHKVIQKPVMDRGYAVIDRAWKNGDTVELNLPMPARWTSANPLVKADRGLAAIERGPIVYCVEQCDQTAPIASLGFAPGQELKVEPGLLLGRKTAFVKGIAAIRETPELEEGLYHHAATEAQVSFTAIPYYAWDNREPGPMKVWLPSPWQPELIHGLEHLAKVQSSFTNNNSDPEGINDGMEVEHSSDQPDQLCHWWPRKGTSEWAQYTWAKPVTLSGTEVYWFDDTGRGECRLPESWHIEYLDGAEWKPVTARGDYTVEKDRWCKVEFAPVRTAKLRLVMQLQKNWSVGVHEWKVKSADK